MSYYRTCPFCGSNLDPGEICNCRQGKEKAAASAANTDDGKAEKVTTDHISASNDT